MEKKFRLLLLLALLLTAATGAWAEEQVVYTLDGTQTASNTNYATAGVVNQGGMTWMVTGNVSMNPWRIGGKDLSGVDRPVWSENSLDETVTKVTLEFGEANSITVNSITMTVAGDADFNNVIDSKAVTFSANNTVDVTPTEGKEWKNAYYRFVFNVSVSGSTNRFVQLKSIKFYNDPAAAAGYTVSMKSDVKDADKWTVKVGEGQAQALPIGGLKGDGSETVTLQYNGRLKVKGVKATSDAAPAAPTGNIVDLSTLTADYEAQNGDVLTGTLAANVKITIADGATVTLSGAVINGENNSFWAGLTLAGDGTIILSGENSVKGFYEDYPGIFVPVNKTLTIQGDGSLTASSNGYGAGIGGGFDIASGNITIDGGTITATGGNHAAGIGSGNGGSSCGAITITSGVTKVTATKADNATNSIGKGSGDNATCGTVTIGGTVYPDGISTSPYTYQPSN